MVVIPRGLAVDLTPRMVEQLEAFAKELLAMNQRVNLVSRADEDSIASRHIPHCLTLAIRTFPDNARVCDWGTGGGLPLIPLAILFPRVHFIGVDAVQKKTMAVQTMARRIGLENVTAIHTRAEEGVIPHHLSVSRATAPLKTLWQWHGRNVVLNKVRMEGENEWSGLVCLKGGDLEEEIESLLDQYPNASIVRRSIADLMDDPYFSTKEIIQVTGP